MPWTLTGDLGEFTDAAGAFLQSRPVHNTVMLTLIGTLRLRGLQAYGQEKPIFGVFRGESGSVQGALLQTPPYPMIFSALPAEAAASAVAGFSFTGVNVTADVLDEFVRGREDFSVKMRTRLHLLSALTPPPMPPGRPRSATAGDRDLLLRWHRKFYDEIGEQHGDFGPAVDERLSYGGITLWEVDGTPVSMAIRSRAEAGMIRVQIVYTPHELRRRGYAGAVTTVASRAALDQGVSSVVLVTDLANPTSNALYHRLGYRPVEDRVVVEFTS